jgi:hypothetical protein
MSRAASLRSVPPVSPLVKCGDETWSMRWGRGSRRKQSGESQWKGKDVTLSRLCLSVHHDPIWVAGGVCRCHWHLQPVDFKWRRWSWVKWVGFIWSTESRRAKMAVPRGWGLLLQAVTSAPKFQSNTACGFHIEGPRSGGPVLYTHALKYMCAHVYPTFHIINYMK